ncbi:hypothetical protein Tco_1353482 [Tanacetum coccineum]
MHTTMVPVQVKTMKIQAGITSFRKENVQKTTSAVEALWKTILRCYLYLLGTFIPSLRLRTSIQEVWICQILQENSQKRTRERMSDQEAKEIKAEAREIMPQPSTVNCS